MSKPLLTMLKWLTSAAFGLPVVPDVNWMLAPESGDIDGCRFSIAATSLSDDFSKSLKLIAPLKY